jgi:uncharacterized membrane protein
MKKLSMWLMALTFCGLTACIKSEPGGGSTAAKSFTIEGPAMAPSIRQGDAHTVSLKIQRGKEFAQTVKLAAETPSGIEAVLSDRTLKPAEKGDVKLELVVRKDAALGDQIIRVTGTPDAGTATSLDVKVKVTEGSDNTRLALKGPSQTTTIKQGETETIKVSFEPRDKYLADVKVTVDAPKGITAEVSPSITKAADKGEATIRVTADKQATLGEHTIHVSGTADAATVNPVDVRIKVVAP